LRKRFKLTQASLTSSAGMEESALLKKQLKSRGLKREGQTQPLKHYTKVANALNIELKVLF